MGLVDKYTWVDIGSSYLLSDLLASFLYAQLEKMNEITFMRRKIWEYYYQNLEPLQRKGYLRLPRVLNDREQNYHMFYIILNSRNERDKLIQVLKENSIQAVFHYVPLHLSPMGKKLGYNRGDFPVAEDLSERLLRLPFFNVLNRKEQDKVIKIIKKVYA